MALHTIAWAENIDGAGTEQELAAVVDPARIYAVQAGDFFRVPGRMNQIVGVAAQIATTTTSRLRFQSPSLDDLFGRDQAFVPFINGGTADIEMGSPQAFNDWRQVPMPLKPGEDVRVMHVSNPAAAADQSVVAIVADGPVAPVSAERGFWARATTAASALTALTWGDRALTFTTQLRTGWYEILAGRVIGDTLISAALVHEEGNNNPPLHVADSPADLPHRAFEVPGQWGVLARFHTNNPPSVRLLANDADNQSQDCLFYVRPVGR